jgi:hypothetical protein
MVVKALRVARSRDATVGGRVIAGVCSVAPAALRCGRRARSLVLQVAGLGLVTAAAWQVASALGLLVGGVALLVVEWLTTPADSTAASN